MSEGSGNASDAGPRIDGRRRGDIEDALRAMVPYYTDEWEPGEDDVGTALLQLFAELSEEVTERLDRVPEKHRVSFFESLGFGRRPPQPARLPLSLEVADRAGGNVTVPAGTVAKAEGEGGEVHLFEVPADGAFDATPANLQTVFSVEPETDAVYGHHGAIDGGTSSTLFGPRDDRNLQEHRFYLADAERLSVGPDSTVVIEIDTDTAGPLLHTGLHWEYHGERTVGGETVEQWHPFPSQTDDEATESSRSSPGGTGGFPRVAREQTRRNDDGNVELEFTPDGPLTETTVNGIESRWIRCTLPVDSDDALFGIRFGTDSSTIDTPVRIMARSGGDLQPDKLMRNDVPLEQSAIRPFGTWPRESDTFYIGSTDAFTKPGAAVTITFTPPSGHRPGDLVVDREADPKETAVVIARVDETADEWIVYQEETVAYQNRRFDYPDDDRVVLVTYKKFLDEDWEGWQESPSGDLFEGVMERNIKFHAFPESRLKGVGTTSAREAPHNPELSWEYFDGDGWSTLAGPGRTFRDGTSQLQHAGTVEFTVPNDLSETTVSGHEGHWIRVRLVGGGYGELRTEPIPPDNPKKFEQVEDFDEPLFDRIRLTYEQADTPDHALPYNNLDFGPDRASSDVDSYSPFKRLPTEDQSVYFGFDASLSDGPINLLFDLADRAYQPTFHPRLRWERYDGTDDAWQRLDVRDHTEGLTERGIVGLVFPEATEPSRSLGLDRHWVRARVTGEPFDVTDAGNGTETEPVLDAQECGRSVETVPPAGDPGRHPPTVNGLYSNAVWVRNRRSIDGEVLGSSDGSVDQTFSVGSPPVIDADVWVDELAVLSEGGREALREARPDRTRVETGPTGEPSAFWVRWDRQPDLLDSGPDARHYTLDPIDGTVSFGDGTNGMIPPRGADNIRADYETGGGAAGNVPAGAVSGFQQSLAFVESVTNPIAGSAGADAEATEAVTGRAARQLRDRNRAVAPADLERIARDASREIARARCLPGMDKTGQQQPGWVTVLIVPDTATPKPVPSTTLLETVETTLADHAPATLIGMDQLVVRGPSYVSVSVDADLAVSGGSISRAEERARDAVRSYLHPLTGGPTGDGWGFGELPCRSDFFELLEGLGQVDHVGRLALEFETDRSHVRIVEGDESPGTSADALAVAGNQRITARRPEQGGGR